MTVVPTSRVNYFDGQHIRLAEMKDEQAYHIELRRRHQLSHHSWGIVLGLEIVIQSDGRAALQPGLAIDGYGRELFFAAHRIVDRDTFARYGTSRLDLWLEYTLELSDDRLAPRECGDDDPRRHYRATERAQLVFTRGGARPDPRRPPGVPPEALEEPLLATPDDPRRRWPVYLGRVSMELSGSGEPRYQVDTSDRVYVGLNAELIDHPGNETRLELGRRLPEVDSRTIGEKTVEYAAASDRDFAVFVPGKDNPLQPTLAVYPKTTQVRGAAEIHGNLILDGGALMFPEPGIDTPAATNAHPALYVAKGASGDELRLDMGSLGAGERKLVLGATKDGQFVAALEIRYPTPGSANPIPLVTVLGDLRIEGGIKSNDMRTRIVTEEVAAMLTGMFQAGLAMGANNP